MTVDNSEAKVKEILDAIDRCKPEDFDGHLDFEKLSLDDKLRWISMSARFIVQYADPKAFDEPVPPHWPPLPKPRDT